MAVRLLAGPFNATFDGAPPDLVVEPTLHMWIPGSGGMLAKSGAPTNTPQTGVLTMDGRYCDRSNELMDHAGWWPAKQRIVQQDWVGVLGGDYSALRELTYDPISFSRQYTGPEEDRYLTPLGLDSYIKLPDRRLVWAPSGSGESAHSFKGVVDGIAIPEGPPDPFNNPFFGVRRIHPGRSDIEVFVEANGRLAEGGRGLFYDTLTRQWSSPMYSIGMKCYSLVYSTDFGVLVSLHNNVSNPEELDDPRRSSQLRIWSLEVHPTILTPAEAVSGAVKSGQIVTYRVRLTGDQDDGAEGELVQWSVGGAGVLFDPQSKTDAEGYATARVGYEIGETGESIIGAGVLC